MATPAVPGLAARVLYMIVYAIVFWMLCWILAAASLAQLVLTLLAGRRNEDLARFGGGLARYARQLIEYLTFVTDQPPFPFSDWPGA